MPTLRATRTTLRTFVWVRDQEVDLTDYRLGRLLDRAPTEHEITLTLVLLDGLRAA